MPTKSILISSVAAAAAVVGGLAYWLLPADEAVVPVPAPHAAIQDKSPTTVAHRWQWQNFSKIESEPGQDSDAGKPNAAGGELPANVVAIYRILQSIKLDENG